MAFRVLGSDDRRPYFCERVHVERQVVEVVLVVDDGAVRVAVEVRKAAHIVPDFLVVGMEDVRAVLVHVDSALLVSVDVPRDVSAPLDHEALLPAGCQQVRERRVEQPRAHEKIVVMGMRNLVLLISIFSHVFWLKDLGLKNDIFKEPKLCPQLQARAKSKSRMFPKSESILPFSKRDEQFRFSRLPICKLQGTV